MARGGAAAAARCERRRKEKEGAGETGWREWPGSLRRRPDQGGLEAGRGASNAGVRPPRVKALVWFWIIDETLVLTSMLSVCVDLMRLVHAK